MTLKNSKKQNDWSSWNVKLNSHGCRWLLIAKWALKITFITSWGIILPELNSNINVKCTRRIIHPDILDYPLLGEENRVIKDYNSR